MLLAFVGIIMGGTAFLWQSGINTVALEKDSLRAFYLAQAGIERGRAEIAFHTANDDYNATLTNQIFGGGSYDLVITDHFGGNADTKEMVSTGRFGNSTREIRMIVGRATVGLPPYGNAWGWHTRNDDAWEEQ